jgi:hypothetical protein
MTRQDSYRFRSNRGRIIRLEVELGLGVKVMMDGMTAGSMGFRPPNKR